MTERNMPREIWAKEMHPYAYAYRNGEWVDTSEGVESYCTKYLLFSAHEEEVRNLHADYALVREQNEKFREEVEWLTTREQKWRELERLRHDLFTVPTTARLAAITRIDQLRSELMEQGGEE